MPIPEVADMAEPSWRNKNLRSVAFIIRGECFRSGGQNSVKTIARDDTQQQQQTATASHLALMRTLALAGVEVKVLLSTKPRISKQGIPNWLDMLKSSYMEFRPRMHLTAWDEGQHVAWAKAFRALRSYNMAADGAMVLRCDLQLKAPEILGKQMLNQFDMSAILVPFRMAHAIQCQTVKGNACVSDAMHWVPAQHQWLAAKTFFGHTLIDCVSAMEPKPKVKYFHPEEWSDPDPAKCRNSLYRFVSRRENPVNKSSFKEPTNIKVMDFFMRPDHKCVDLHREEEARQ